MADNPNYPVGTASVGWTDKSGAGQLHVFSSDGYDVIERHIKPEELDQFEECFLTGTAAEVTPVSKLGDLTFTPAEACKTLIAAYMEEVQPKRAAAE